MEYWINLQYPVDKNQLEKIFDFYVVKGDTIIFHFHINGIDLTNYAIRGEVYDLNVSNRMANTLGFPQSAPEIVVDDAVNGRFTATVAAGLTSVMQIYGQVEFEITSASGVKSTIMQQPIRFVPERVIWENERQAIIEGDTEGENPLF
jgi:hypothetical protein